jgi:DNA repair protein RecO (recombination protein O)
VAVETLTTAAILLRSSPYGEAARVVSLLGRTSGRIGAIARGARKSQRRFVGMGLGALGEASFRERAGADLAWLERFEVIEGRLGLGSDLGRMAQAGYVAELCDKLCAPHQPEVQVFDWLNRFLGHLETTGASSERLRVFELGLLQRLGLGPAFDSCVGCGRVDLVNETVRLQPERGGVVCDGCARRGTPLSAPVRRALVALSGLDLDRALELPLDRDMNAACRNAIFELLGSHLPGALKSIEFVEKIGGL